MNFHKLILSEKWKVFIAISSTAPSDQSSRIPGKDRKKKYIVQDLYVRRKSMMTWKRRRWEMRIARRSHALLDNKRYYQHKNRRNWRKGKKWGWGSGMLDGVVHARHDSYAGWCGCGVWGECRGSQGCFCDTSPPALSIIPDKKINSRASALWATW